MWCALDFLMGRKDIRVGGIINRQVGDIGLLVCVCGRTHTHLEHTGRAAQVPFLAPWAATLLQVQLCGVGKSGATRAQAGLFSLPSWSVREPRPSMSGRCRFGMDLDLDFSRVVGPAESVGDT